jgi:hypothetical protein
MATVARLESVSGVRIPDTPLTKAAVDLLEATSPQFICNHCVRTYVFGSLAVKSIGRSIIDEEIAFCGYGLRSGEIRALRLDDIDWDKEVLRIRHTKTGATS